MLTTDASTAHQLVPEDSMRAMAQSCREEATVNLEESREIKMLLKKQKLRRLTMKRPSVKEYIKNILQGLGQRSQKECLRHK